MMKHFAVSRAMCAYKYRMSNHPDLGWIIMILLANPES